MPLTTRRRTRLNVLGIVVLLAGFSVGAFLYWHGPQPDAEEDDVLLAQEQTKAYDQAVQRNVGAVGLLMSRWSETISQLGRPGPLAIMIVAVAGVTAGGLFRAASRSRE